MKQARPPSSGAGVADITYIYILSISYICPFVDKSAKPCKHWARGHFFKSHLSHIFRLSVPHFPSIITNLSHIFRLSVPHFPSIPGPANKALLHIKYISMLICVYVYDYISMPYPFACCLSFKGSLFLFRIV